MMVGTANQVECAEQIRERVNAEFDRIARALKLSAAKQTGQDQADTEAVIVILEDKRAEVMSKSRADYFIHNWRVLNDQVRAIISADSRYLDIRTRKALRGR